MVRKVDKGSDSLCCCVFVVEDHPFVRQCYAQMLEEELEMEVAGEAATCLEAREGIRHAGPDLVLADISLEGKADGIDLVRHVKRDHPELPVLVVSGRDELYFARRALEVGARGFLSKHHAADHLVDAVREVLQGRVYLSQRMRELL